MDWDGYRVMRRNHHLLMVNVEHVTLKAVVGIRR